MAAYTLVVMTNPVAGKDAEYNDWYDNQHVPDVLRIDGFTGAQRFKVADETPDTPFQYCALYQVETDNLGDVLGALNKAAGTEAMPMSPALDQKLSMNAYRALSPLVKAKS